MQIPALSGVMRSSGAEYLGINKSGEIAIIKVKDSTGHEHGADGKFSGSGGGGAGKTKKPGKAKEKAPPKHNMGMLTPSEYKAHEKQTKQHLNGASQQEIKRFAAATEAQMKTVNHDFLSKPGGRANYQRMHIEYGVARSLIKSLDYSQIHPPRLGGSTMKLDEDEEMQDEGEEELQKEGSDLDFVKERLADESGGVEALSQALEGIQDPKLKEIMAAIQEDEKKHQAALEQWASENGGGDAEEDAPAEDEAEDDTEKDEDGDVPGIEEDDGGKGELIDQIRAVLEEHDDTTEKADDPDEEDPEKEDTEKSDDGDDDDKPDFLKEDDEEEEDIDVGKSGVAKFMPIVKLDNEQHKAYCIVAEPDVFDLQGDRSTAEEMRKSAHHFMERLQKQCCPGVGYNHEDPIDAYVIENVITQQDRIKLGNQTLRKGTWYQGHKIEDERIWKMIKSGEITGLSRQGQGTRTPIGKGVIGTVRVSKSGAVRKAERFNLADEEIDRVDWVHKGANGARVAIIKFEDTNFKEGIMMKTKPAGARAGAGAAQVTKADIEEMISVGIQKAVKPLVETVQKQSTKMRKQELEGIAKSYLGELGNPGETATSLMSLEDSDMSASAKEGILKTLKQANAVKREAMAVLGTQMGSSRPAPGSATAQFEVIVQKHVEDIRKSADDNKMDERSIRARAYTLATKENPGVAKLCKAEQNASRRVM